MKVPKIDYLDEGPELKAMKSELRIKRKVEKTPRLYVSSENLKKSFIFKYIP